MKKTLAIVIPAYNEEAIIGRCLEACLVQTVPASAIIVVDNNSTDQTARIASSFPGVTVIKESKQGRAYARGAGFDHASSNSEIIGRIDADTLIDRHWVESVTKIFEDERIAAATGPVSYYDMPIPQHSLKFDNFFRTNIKKYIKDFHFLYGSNMALRRDVWEQIREGVCLDDADLHEDIDLALHIYEIGGQLAYDNRMVASVSARRFQDTPAQFYRYLKRFTNTYHRHHQERSLARVPMGIYLALYPPLKAVRAFYQSEFRLATNKSISNILKEISKKD